MKTPILHSVYEMFAERERVRKLKVGFLCVTLIGGWLFMVYLVLKTPKAEFEEYHVSAPAVVASNPTSSSSNSTAMPSITRTSSPFRHSISVSTPSTPATSMPSGGYTMTIHTTSSAMPVSIGGGGGYGGNGNSQSSGNVQRGISPTIGYSAPSLALLTSMSSTSSVVESSQSRLAKRNLTADNTLTNMQEVIARNAPNATVTRAKKDQWDGYDQDEEPFPDPIGDVPWVMMALLTIAMCVRVRLKKRQACK